MGSVGQAVWRSGPRPIFLFGLALFGVSVVGMMHWTHLSGWNDIFWPQVGRGIAMGAMFVPLSTATLRTLPPSEVQKGAGLYNLFRQIGGSFGIAVLATLLDQRAAVHRAVLVEHVSPFHPLSRMRIESLGHYFASRGFHPTHAFDMATQTVSRLIDQQAITLAFEDAYAFIALACVLAIPLALMIRGGRPKQLEEIPTRRPGAVAIEVIAD